MPELQVSLMGITGQMHGVVLWHSSHPRATHSNLITWQDGRCTSDEISQFNLLGGETTKAWPLSSGYGCASLAWLARHYPAQLDQYDRVGTIMVCVWLCVCVAVCMGVPSDAVPITGLYGNGVHWLRQQHNGSGQCGQFRAV